MSQQRSCVQPRKEAGHTPGKKVNLLVSARCQIAKPMRVARGRKQPEKALVARKFRLRSGRLGPICWAPRKAPERLRRPSASLQIEAGIVPGHSIQEEERRGHPEPEPTLDSNKNVVEYSESPPGPNYSGGSYSPEGYRRRLGASESSGSWGCRGETRWTQAATPE